MKNSKAFLILGIFALSTIFYSCSDENESLDSQVLDTSFISKLEKNTFGDTELVSNNLNLRINSRGSINITDDVTEQDISEINNVNRLIGSYLNYEIVEECTGPKCLVIIEEEIDAQQEALLQAAKDYLYSMGYDDSDLLEILDGHDEITLIALVAEIQLVYEIERRAVILGFNSGVPYLSFIDELNNMMDTDNPTLKLPQWAICAVEAIGLDIAYSFFSEGAERLGKHSLKKAIRKIASKFLGPVGVGIAIAEFGWCMYTS